jgi:hypothetical protein
MGQLRLLTPRTTAVLLTAAAAASLAHAKDGAAPAACEIVVRCSSRTWR